MIVTNNYGLPDEFVNAVKRNNELRNHISPSMLTKGICQVVLERRHWDEVEQDAMDSLWLLFGQSVHSFLESKNPGEHTEKSVTADFNGVELKGTMDIFKNGIIQDWKVTSAWSIVYQSSMKSWIVQLNAYRRLLEKNGYEVTGMRINAILRDWSESKVSADSNYPQKPVVMIDIPVLEDIDNYIVSRAAEIEATAICLDHELQPCTEEERWQDPVKYAVMKGTNKRAVRVLDSLEAAETLAAQTEKGRIEERPSVPRKCEKYCTVNKWCHFWRSYQNES